MGIDLAGMRFLQHALSGRKLGDTVTLGRQEIHIWPGQLKKEFGAINPDPQDPFCEWFLTSHFSASSIVSIDNSAYENATFIHDINKPVPPHFSHHYDTVLDFGTTEHVFDIAQAIRNCITMCKLNGYIVHYIPANNQCGHGFWQISPELFFSLYSEKNGFRDTEVFMVAPDYPDEFYRVKRPINGRRAMVDSKIPLMVAAYTRKVQDNCDALIVQQSDYVTAWSKDEHTQHADYTSSGKIKAWLRNYPELYNVIASLKSRLSGKTNQYGFHSKNPWLERIILTSDNSDSRA